MSVARLIAAGILLFGLASTAISEDSPVLVGTVTNVVDGDTIKVELSSGTISVRFGNIDAPESNQPGGPEAKAALSEYVLHQEVFLDVMEQDRYERLVAVVFLGESNVNEWLVEHGLAWAYRQYLQDSSYCVLEHEARSDSRGLWEFQRPIAPWDWRRNSHVVTDYSDETVAGCIAAKGRPLTAPQDRSAVTSNSSSTCLIKGNVSSNGRIYHVPGSPSYDATKIDEAKGERWFCTEDDAKAAGWRLPRR